VDENFQVFAHKNSFKYANTDIKTFPEPIKRFFDEIHSKRFLDFVSFVTGIKDLRIDPGLVGGGMHQSISGGFLNIHADFTHHRDMNLRRALNILVYFNKDWKPDYNGQLELWDKNMKSCVRSISPDFNRCVIFNTTGNSYHGHPKPLNLPKDKARRSLAAYYYTDWTDDDKAIPKKITTSYQPLPWEYKKRTIQLLKNLARPIVRRFRRKS
jgi:hypothetical protein